MKKVFLSCLLTIGLCPVFLTGCILSKGEESEQRFSFAVLADPRNYGDTWTNALLEIRDRKCNRDPIFSPAELIVVAGDMDPLASRDKDFRQVFTNADTRPIFLPVIGNHEFDNGGESFRYARDVLIPSIPRVARRHAGSCDYYLDFRNVRIFSIDGYTDIGNDGVINDEGRLWVEQVIKATPSSIDHIFISFHEPAFPRIRHVGDSFDQDAEKRNAFWRMLVEHGDRVRAVFVGHTHFYSRMRVLDPAGAAANNPQAYPDEDGGIYQVIAGASGQGSLNTIVNVQIEGKNVLFRVLQAEIGSNMSFTEIDEWNIVNHP
jgi:hypothetical protein